MDPTIMINDRMRRVKPSDCFKKEVAITSLMIATVRKM
jgi:hypothetical protein